MIRLTCILFGHTWDEDETCGLCGADKWVVNTGHPRPSNLTPKDEH
jgi:hypothetical protein